MTVSKGCTDKGFPGSLTQCVVVPVSLLLNKEHQRTSEAWMDDWQCGTWEGSTSSRLLSFFFQLTASMLKLPSKRLPCQSMKQSPNCLQSLWCFLLRSQDAQKPVFRTTGIWAKTAVLFGLDSMHLKSGDSLSHSPCPPLTQRCDGVQNPKNEKPTSYKLCKRDFASCTESSRNLWHLKSRERCRSGPSLVLPSLT